MAIYRNGQWLVGSPSFAKWVQVEAKNLRGAKRCATNEFQVAVGGKIQVAQAVGADDNQQVVEMAVKHGYDNWIDAA